MSSPNLSEPAWAAFVAIDWGDRKHCWKLCPATDTRHCESGQIDSKPEALHDWLSCLSTRFGGQPVAVCLEQSRGALIYTLSAYSSLHIFPVNPATSARYRLAFRPSGSKSDRGDTDLLLDLLLHHRDQLRQLEPDTPATRELRMLVESRRKFVDMRTGLSNSLTAQLKLYFPQALDWVSNIDSPMGCDLLQRWPSLPEIQQARPETLRSFFTRHHLRSQACIAGRIEAIGKAVPATLDSVLVNAATCNVRHLVAILQQLNAAIQNYDDRIEAAVAAHPGDPPVSDAAGCRAGAAAPHCRRLRDTAASLHHSRRCGQLLRYRAGQKAEW
jgi:transposase